MTSPEKQDPRWREHRRRLALLTDAHPLRYLFFEVTRRCNLKCAYCGSSCEGTEAAAELSAAEWVSIVEQIAEDFPEQKPMVAVTGGEPLLKAGIFEVFAALRRHGLPYGMVSNGFLIDGDAARRLVEVGMGSISISMDAPAEVNDALRGRGASARVRSAVLALREAGFTGKLEIISTLTRPAVPLLDAMRRFVAELRVPYWRVAPVMPIGRAAQRPELVPGPLEVRQILEYVRLARQDDLLPKPEFCEEGFLGRRFEKAVRPYFWQCRAGITTGGISSDGRIGACPELSAAFAQGDIRTERFKEVWETRYQLLRDRAWTHRGVCATCDQLEICGGAALHLFETPEAEPLRCLYLLAKEAESQGAMLCAPVD